MLNQSNDNITSFGNVVKQKFAFANHPFGKWCPNEHIMQEEYIINKVYKTACGFTINGYKFASYNVIDQFENLVLHHDVAALSLIRASLGWIRR